MSHYTKEDILRLVEEEDIAFIRLQFTDIFGTMKNLAITPTQLKKALDKEILFDGSAIDGFADVESSDMLLVPELDTFTTFPWRPQKGRVARLICNVHNPDGSPFDCDPRLILKKVLEDAADMGYDFQVGPECEFFLFDTDEEGRPTTHTNENATYFDLGPLDFGENARRDIVLTLEDMGFEVEASHHENASGQHEIDFKYGDALLVSDQIMTFKMVVKTIAKRHGLHATFMPKPKKDCYGSGMHLNFSLTRDGINIFYDPKDENGLSREAYYFIGGLMKHIKAITFITNPLVNSYKRLVPGYEAPVNIAWSLQNRSPLIRIPATKGMHQRIELRSPDPSANPYLAIAVCLAAGLEGIRQQILPPEPVNTNIFQMSEEEMRAEGIERLPRSLRMAADEFEKDELIRAVLGESLSKKYMKAKLKEYMDYRAYVTNWEIDRYLQRY